MRDPEVIRNSDGNIIKTSRNLRGIREHVSHNLVKVVGIDRIGDKHLEGKLLILFENGDSYETNFASYEVLCDFLGRWRNIYGAKLIIGGSDCGTISSKNPNLMRYDPQVVKS